VVGVGVGVGQITGLLDVDVLASGAAGTSGSLVADGKDGWVVVSLAPLGAAGSDGTLDGAGMGPSSVVDG
jgi:hypothetical protein